MLIVHVTNSDPAGAAYNLVRAVNEHTPHRARLISTVRLPSFDFPYDIHDLFDSGDEIEALLQNADVIHIHKVHEDFMFEFQLAQSIRKFNLRDYVAGKKVIHHIHGHPSERNFPKENAEYYKSVGRLVLASTPDLEQMYRPFYERVQYFPNCVPINDVHYLPRATDAMLTGADGESKRFCIFQSGTNSVLKNMHVIREVCDRLAKELPLFFLHTSPDCIQPQNHVLQSKRIAHVVFDHLEGYYGLSSLEGLSMGKPVLAGLNDYCVEAIKKFFGVSRLPWIIVKNEQEVENAIRVLLDNFQAREMAGKDGRRFMEQVWSDKFVAQQLVKVYESL